MLGRGGRACAPEGMDDPATAAVPTVRPTLHASDGGPALSTIEIEPIDVTGWAETPPTGVAVHRRYGVEMETDRP